MNQPVEFDFSGAGYIVDAPIIDLLAHEPELRCYVAEFVPDAQVSPERKESVYIPDQGKTARRIGELLEELTGVLHVAAPIVKVAHAGGGDFDLYSQQGDVYHLHEPPSPQFSFDVYAILQVISQEVQLEFISQRRTHRAAG